MLSYHCLQFERDVAPQKVLGMGTMLGGLEDNELHILALLKRAPDALQNELRQGLQLPRRLLEFSLMRRDAQGELALLPAGERLLFQLRCIDALQTCMPGPSARIDDADALAWLLSSRFLSGSDNLYHITARGQEWLDSVALPALEGDG